MLPPFLFPSLSIQFPPFDLLPCSDIPSKLSAHPLGAALEGPWGPTWCCLSPSLWCSGCQPGLWWADPLPQAHLLLTPPPHPLGISASAPSIGLYLPTLELIKEGQKLIHRRKLNPYRGWALQLAGWVSSAVVLERVYSSASKTLEEPGTTTFIKCLPLLTSLY